MLFYYCIPHVAARRIQVSKATKELLASFLPNNYTLEERGRVEIKVDLTRKTLLSIGTWYVLGQRQTDDLLAE